MHIKVPGQLFDLGSTPVRQQYVTYHTIPDISDAYAFGEYLCSPNKMREVDVPNYFSSSRGLPFNNVVHCKLSGGGSSSPSVGVWRYDEQMRVIVYPANLRYTTRPPSDVLFAHDSFLVNKGRYSMRGSPTQMYTNWDHIWLYYTVNLWIWEIHPQFTWYNTYRYEGYVKFRLYNGGAMTDITCSDDTLGLEMKLSVARGMDGHDIMSGRYSVNRDELERLYQILFDTCTGLSDHIYQVGYVTHWAGWAYKQRSYTEVASFKVQLPNLGPSRFILDEPSVIGQGIEPLLLGKEAFPANHWRNVLTQQAYLDALQSVPRLNENSISNIIEIVSFIKALVVDHRIEIPKSIQGAWLSYRYQYATTKLDAEEAISFVHRHMDLGDSNWFSCYGISRFDFRGIPITCRCGLKIRPKDVSTLENLWRTLYTYGLQPNFYVLWDSLPYSFMVDWFLPVGKLATVADAQRMYSGTYYDIRDVCFSLSYDNPEGVATHQYTRWYQGSPPALNGYYFLEEQPVTTKVLGYRILDALSLFIK